MERTLLDSRCWPPHTQVCRTPAQPPSARTNLRGISWLTILTLAAYVKSCNAFTSPSYLLIGRTRQQALSKFPDGWRNAGAMPAVGYRNPPLYPSASLMLALVMKQWVDFLLSRSRRSNVRGNVRTMYSFALFYGYPYDERWCLILLHGLITEPIYISWVKSYRGLHQGFLCKNWSSLQFTYSIWGVAINTRQKQLIVTRNFSRIYSNLAALKHIMQL